MRRRSAAAAARSTPRSGRAPSRAPASSCSRWAPTTARRGRTKKQEQKKKEQRSKKVKPGRSLYLRPALPLPLPHSCCCPPSRLRPTFLCVRRALLLFVSPSAQCTHSLSHSNSTTTSTLTQGSDARILDLHARSAASAAAANDGCFFLNLAELERAAAPHTHTSPLALSAPLMRTRALARCPAAKQHAATRVCAPSPPSPPLAAAPFALPLN